MLKKLTKRISFPKFEAADSNSPLISFSAKQFEESFSLYSFSVVHEIFSIISCELLDNKAIVKFNLL